jgi:phospholipid/cholesterol/gamma-HCH transport system permease protein
MDSTRKISVWPSGAGSVELRLSGDFTLAGGIEKCQPYLETLGEKVKKVIFVDAGIQAWDSALLAFLMAISKACEQREIECNLTDIPNGAQRLIKLATAVPERQGAARTSEKISFVEKLGIGALNTWQGALSSISFIGGATASIGRMFRGKAQYRKSDMLFMIQQCGPQALGIVTTICILVGAILAFVGAIQLKMFGAEVYVANLVGISMVMEMGALMTGIILSGRTGAAFAAQIGTMQVNEEIDALQTLGIEPMDYLVLPRMLALVIMTPLLVIYADILGIIGGAAVGIFLIDIPARLFMNQTFEMMTSWQCIQGLIKGSVFGMIVAISGCMRGMQCGRSASAVGEAATSAVVTSIVAIVVADAILTLIFMMIG